MARPRSSDPKSIKQLVQKRRDGLYASGHRNLNMALSEQAIAQLDAWKARYRLRSRDAVVARVIERCMASAHPTTFLQRAAAPEAVLRRISPIVAVELADYLKEVQRRFRSVAYGPIFEMLMDRIGDALVAPARGANDAGEGFSARKHERSAAAAATVLTVVTHEAAPPATRQGRTSAPAEGATGSDMRRASNA